MKNNKYPKWLVWTLVAIGAIVLFLFIGAPSTNKESLSSSTTTKVEAPQFILTDIDGRSLSLSQYRGKVVILNFWAPWCPPCRREIPDLISLQNQYGAQGLQIIGIGLDQPNNVAAFVRQNSINYPVAVGDADVAQLYGGVSGIPTTFIIDKQGNIRKSFEGFTRKSVFEEEIKKFL